MANLKGKIYLSLLYALGQKVYTKLLEKEGALAKGDRLRFLRRL